MLLVTRCQVNVKMDGVLPLFYHFQIPQTKKQTLTGWFY
ncbi:hypothetical protein yrohd0001_21400 [Yersinia rohdei ATCC 43380]|nr:hypothetical protein yrohd0001_21400 [Yersinia rohdei ATCC 43380]